MRGKDLKLLFIREEVEFKKSLNNLLSYKESITINYVNLLKKVLNGGGIQEKN